MLSCQHSQVHLARFTVSFGKLSANQARMLAMPAAYGSNFGQLQWL
jgi:hypothetical protein